MSAIVLILREEKNEALTKMITEKNKNSSFCRLHVVENITDHPPFLTVGISFFLYNDPKPFFIFPKKNRLSRWSIISNYENYMRIFYLNIYFYLTLKLMYLWTQQSDDNLCLQAHYK